MIALLYAVLGLAGLFVLASVAVLATGSMMTTSGAILLGSALLALTIGSGLALVARALSAKGDQP